MPRQPDYRKRLADLTRELADTLVGMIAGESARHAPSKSAARRGSAAAAAAPRKRGRMKLSRAARAQRVLQGKYMSLIRQIPKNKRAAYKKMRTDKGYVATMASLNRALKAK